MARTAVATWFGAYLVENGTVVRSYPFPPDAEALAERLAARRRGELVPEERQLLSEAAGAPLVTRDRRLVGVGVALAFETAERVEIAPPPGADLRALVLEDSGRAIAEQWDPSIHIEEAVRALDDLDRAKNLLGERIGSWNARDSPNVAPDDAGAATERWLGPEGGPSSALGIDPELEAGRRELATLYQQLAKSRASLERGIHEALPRRCPNLSSLLGPALAARLLAQAGGLERLSRLPASTIQVLGAERAFFEHLRGRAPPPRHGLLFLHPKLQSAPRLQRGRLARALAGKAAIAARRDRAGAANDPTLLASFERRAAAIRSAPRKGDRRPSRPPLDRAAADRPLRRRDRPAR